MRRPDDDALSWEGDDDPTLDTGADAPETRAPASPVAADESAAIVPEPISDADAPADDLLRPEPNAPAAPSEAAAPAPQRAVADEQLPGKTRPRDPRDELSAPDTHDAEPPEEEERRGLGDAGLVVLGILGGVYLLWTIGWVLGTLRLRDWIQIRTGAVADTMFHGSMVLGILAPVIWFFGAWFLTRHRGAWVRVLALVLGAVVLVPWPFVMVGVIGQ